VELSPRGSPLSHTLEMQQVRRTSRSSGSCSRIGTSYRLLYSIDTLPLPTHLDPSDTLGRPKELTRKKDFSDSDLKMALNAGILFETPEKFFLNASQRIHSHFDVSGSIRLCDVVRTLHERAFQLFRVDFCFTKRKWNQLFYFFAFYNL
jgi:Polynucleotide kinase 3 phosphatase